MTIKILFIPESTEGLADGEITPLDAVSYTHLDNPVVKKCYAEYLGEPGSHKAHEILHTTYTPRPKMK